jgi:hypothetical protein
MYLVENFLGRAQKVFHCSFFSKDKKAKKQKNNQSNIFLKN